MGEELKFQQRWEFRKRDNDFESSSDDLKSHSSSEPAFKKHKLVPSFVSCEDDETDNSPALQPDAETNLNEDPKENGKAKRVQRGRSKKDKLASGEMGKSSQKGSRRGKAKTSTYGPVPAMDDLKMFMESLVDDLKGTRENLFAWMKDEMQKLVADVNVPQSSQRVGCYAEENIPEQHQRNFEGNIDEQPQNIVQGNVEAQHQKDFKSQVKVKRTAKRKKTDKSGNSSQAIEDQATNGQATRRKKSTKKDKVVALESSVNPTVESTPSDQNGQQQLQNQNFALGTQAQNCNVGSQELSVQCRKIIDLSTSSQVLENQADLGQVARSLTSVGKVGEERLGLPTQHPHCSSITSDQNDLLQNQNKFESSIRYATPIEKDIRKRFGASVKPNISSNPSGQVDSSMYLTLPSVLTEPCFENNKLDMSSYNYMQSRISGSRMDVNLERSNPILDASARRQYFPGMQQEERVGKFAPISSRSIGCLSQNSTQNTSTGNGFPVPFHQSMDAGFSIPSQASLDNQSRDIWGLRMNGGVIRFTGENHTLPGSYISNNFNSHLNYKTDSGLLSFQASSFKDGPLPPK